MHVLLLISSIKAGTLALSLLKFRLKFQVMHGTVNLKSNLAIGWTLPQMQRMPRLEHILSSICAL